MVGELVLRFLLGGVIVSLFATAGEVVTPKTFAGLFGAAPSVALATLALAFWKEGPAYAGIEGRSMLIASAALIVYSGACVYLSKSTAMPVWVAAGAAWSIWLVVALGLWLSLSGVLQ